MKTHSLIRFHATPEVAPLIDARIDELKATIDLIETNYLGDDNQDYIKVLKRSD